MRFQNGLYYRLPSGQHVQAKFDDDKKKIDLVGVNGKIIESIASNYIDFPGVQEISVTLWESLKSEANPKTAVQAAVYPAEDPQPKVDKTDKKPQADK